MCMIRFVKYKMFYGWCVWKVQFSKLPSKQIASDAHGMVDSFKLERTCG